MKSRIENIKVTPREAHVKPLKKLLRKPKIALFGLLVTFFSAANTHGQAINQQHLNEYYIKTHQLHQQGTNALQADKEFQELTQTIIQELQEKTKTCLEQHQLDQAIIQVALIQKLAEATRNTQLAQEARTTYALLVSCANHDIKQEEIDDFTNHVSTFLELPEETLREALNPEPEERFTPAKIIITHQETTITYTQEPTYRGVNIHQQHTTTPLEVPEELIKQAIKQQAPQLSKQEKQEAYTLIKQAIKKQQRTSH